METALYFIAGIALCVAALAVTAIGLRDKEFPTPAAYKAGAALLASLVAVTMVGAVLNARAEQREHRAHKAAERHGEQPAADHE